MIFNFAWTYGCLLKSLIFLHGNFRSCMLSCMHACMRPCWNSDMTPPGGWKAHDVSVKHILSSGPKFGYLGVLKDILEKFFRELTGGLS